jgi:hypothetical protein
MTALGLPRTLIEDGELAVSELATNAYLHANHAGPAAVPVVAPELWVWVRTCPAPELVVSVFDGDRSALPRITSADPLDECGKGLGIVAAVSASWGTHPSRSRLGNPPVRGKATWFALSLPDPWPGTDRIIPPWIAAQELVTALAARGIGAARRSDDKGISIVQVHGRNVWVGPSTFSWRERHGGYVHHPLVDLHEVAEQVVRLHEEQSDVPPGGPLASQPYARRPR